MITLFSDNIIKNINLECKRYSKRYRKAKLKPIVAFPQAKKLMKSSLDSKQWTDNPKLIVLRGEVSHV